MEGSDSKQGVSGDTAAASAAAAGRAAQARSFKATARRVGLLAGIPVAAITLLVIAAHQAAEIRSNNTAVHAQGSASSGEDHKPKNDTPPANQTGTTGQDSMPDTTRPTGQNGQSTSHTSVTVNGQAVPVPDNGSYNHTTTNDNGGTTHVKVESSHISSSDQGSNNSSSNISINVHSESSSQSSSEGSD